MRVDDALGLALLKIEAKTPEHFQVKNQAVGKLGDTVLSVSNLHQLAVARRGADECSSGDLWGT